MSTQRKLLAVLLAVVAGLAILLAIALRRPSAQDEADLQRAKDPPAPAPRPSEKTESDEERSALPTLPRSASVPGERPARELGPPVKIVGKIGDAKGSGLEAVNVLVYDARGEKHMPEVLRPDWYECTIHERGRALVVAQREGSCSVEVPLEVLPPDEERHVDLVLLARPRLRVHVRDLAGKALPRFPKDQPLRAQLRAVASIEELPVQLPAQIVRPLSGDAGAERPGWADFEPESLQHSLAARAGMRLPDLGRGRSRERNPKSRELPVEISSTLGWDPARMDDERFEHGLAMLRAGYKRRLSEQGRVDPDDPARLFLAALGYLGDDGVPIESETPRRDMIGTLVCARPLPLRVSLLAGQRVLESREPLPWSEDVAFQIDLERLAESYVHVYLFASDGKTGARLPGVRANLHVEPLAGEPGQPPEFSRDITAGYRGKEAPSYYGTSKGWRFPDGEVTTDSDGRADFQAALAGWCRLTLEAEGHVAATKWVFVDRVAECNLGFFELAPLASSRLSVVDPAGKPVRAKFELRSLLHARDNEGLLETWDFESDETGALDLLHVGRQQLLLCSSDPRWALEPLLLDNVAGFVDHSQLQVVPSQHVLLHLPATLPWNSIVNVAQGLTCPLYEEAFAGKTLIDLWVADGTYTLRVAVGLTALMTIKFTVAGDPLLVETAP